MYLSTIVYRIDVHKKSSLHHYEEKTLLIDAFDICDAYQSSFGFGKSGESSFVNCDGLRVDWVFEGVKNLHKVEIGNEPVEILSELKEGYNEFQREDLSRRIQETKKSTHISL